MINQQRTGVTHVLVQGIAAPVRLLKKSLSSSRFTQATVNLDWDEASYADDFDLESDKSKLRDLEAEIYALTDQFKTEQGLNGATLHER